MVWPRGSGKRQWLLRKQTFTIEEKPVDDSAQRMRDVSDETSAIEAKLDPFEATLASAVSSFARIEASSPPDNVIATTAPSAAGKIGRHDPKSGRK